MTGVSIDLRGVPEVQAMLAQFSGGPLNNRVRRALRAGLKPIREEMRRVGSQGKFPRRFRKTRTRGHRHPLGVSVSPQSPLSTIFEHGAKPHLIGSYTHPGMAARPFIAPVFAAAEEKARKAFTDTLMEGL